MKHICACLAAVMACSAGSVFAQGWGTLQGKIVADGNVSRFKPLVAKGENVKDAEVCSVKAIPDDSLVVSEKGEVANCFVYLYLRRGTPDVHPSLKTPEKDTLEFDNQGCRFVPRFMVVRTDQVVKCLNTDPCGHNVRTNPLKNEAYNQLISGGNTTGIDMTHTQSEMLPMQVKCDIHPWMTAYWLVLDHPYSTISKEDGTFKIENMPAGKHDIRIWHERVGFIERTSVEIKDGQVVDLGIVKANAKKLMED